jgi:hypothetical protein
MLMKSPLIPSTFEKSMSPKGVTVTRFIKDGLNMVLVCAKVTVSGKEHLRDNIL